MVADLLKEHLTAITQSGLPCLACTDEYKIILGGHLVPRMVCAQESRLFSNAATIINYISWRGPGVSRAAPRIGLKGFLQDWKACCKPATNLQPERQIEYSHTVQH